MILATCLLVLAAQPEPHLLDRATMITKVGNWVEYQLAVGEYRWWSPTQILAMATPETEVLIDVNTKRKTLVRAPAARHQGDLSPDHTRVISQRWNGKQITWTITDPSGAKNFGSWTITSRTPPPHMDVITGYIAPRAVWSPDGKTIYQTESWPGGNGLYFQVTERPASHPQDGHAYPVATTYLDLPAIVVHGGKVLAIPYDSHDPTFRDIHEWTLSSPEKIPRQEWTVRAPKGQVIVQFAPSPDRRKMLWLMGRSGKKILNENTGYPYRSISLWVSGLHGENMREIGNLPFGTNNEDKQMNCYQHFGCLLWNPDSAHVSFIYNRKLYMVGT